LTYANHSAYGITASTALVAAWAALVLCGIRIARRETVTGPEAVSDERELETAS
jgi:hypothetical protein